MRKARTDIMDARISTHYTTLLLVILLAIKLYAQKKTRGVELRFFWLTLICCLFLVAEDVLEAYAATREELRLFRILMSVSGYVVRPVAAVGLLLVVCPPERRSWKIWISALINLAVNLTAFFSPVAFSFNEKYEFVRGPLGYVVFIVALLYMIQILVLIWRNFYEGKKAERWILICSVIGCMGASLVDALWGGCHLNEAMMTGCIFLLFFLHSHDNFLDPLTSLRNRFAFYDDSERLDKAITAVASIDMNGLKRLNDTKGHAAGDKALTEIGRCMEGINDRDTIAYRVGGDEFVVTFIQQKEEDVAKTIQRLKESVEKAGYSVAAGYAMKAAGQNLDEALSESDRNMYADKAAYYQQGGRDRRARRN